MSSTPHNPVMIDEVLQSLAPEEGKIYVDGTFGAGGYSRAILKAARCTVYGIDRDPSAEQFAEKLVQDFHGRFAFLVGNFADMCELLAERGVEKVDGIVLDLGVSSMQLDQAERGFSFRHDGPLDMRMGKRGISAAEFINTAEEEEIADVIYGFGEERASRRIARAIVIKRTEKPIETTQELADTIRSVMPRKGDKDPATRSFQAIRIHINDELGALTRGLEAAEKLLAPGGKLVVVTFHSLEDRLVKRFTHSRCGKSGGASRYVPEEVTRSDTLPPTFFMPRPEKMKVSAAEAKTNPRARSATLRHIVRSEQEVR